MARAILNGNYIRQCMHSIQYMCSARMVLKYTDQPDAGRSTGFPDDQPADRMHNEINLKNLLYEKVGGIYRI